MRPDPARRAFTLPELLVVIAISVLLLALAVPAFSSVLYSSRRASASSAVETALAAARDVAVESGPGRDAAAVFFYDPAGQLRIMVATHAGQIQDQKARGREPIEREIFVRSERVNAITLPAGWVVSGRARADMIDGRQEWYTDATYPDIDRDNWVFPETAWFDVDDGADGRDRQTFMVRFEGGTGNLTYGDDRSVLVLDPAPTRQFRNKAPWSGRGKDALDATDQRRFVQRILAERGTGFGSAGGRDRFKLLGDESSDTVLARPVGQVAVYNLRRLARGVGARRLNPETGALYMADDQPQYDRSLFAGSVSPREAAERINDWITGQPGFRGEAESDAQIYTVQRYLGRVLEVVPVGKKETP
ncbi:MAG: Tfp pilus assembly protein FimT/FimU [Phycisphaerales bacterium JB039]